MVTQSLTTDVKDTAAYSGLPRLRKDQECSLCHCATISYYAPVIDFRCCYGGGQEQLVCCQRDENVSCPQGIPARPRESSPAQTLPITLATCHVLLPAGPAGETLGQVCSGTDEGVVKIPEGASVAQVASLKRLLASFVIVIIKLQGVQPLLT